MPNPSPSNERSQDQPKVIGIYGLPGSGKTFLLNQLRQKLDDGPFMFFEGSEMIDSLVPGGLEAFKKLNEQRKTDYRRLAIEAIRKQSADSGKSAVVAGHFMFWSEKEEKGTTVCTSSDLATFTHIIYLDVPAHVIAQRQRDDAERIRPASTVAHLTRWQESEQDQLRLLCRDHGILFMVLAQNSPWLDHLQDLLDDFHVHSEEQNLRRVEERLDEILYPHQGRLETVLVLDADRTLAPEDAGCLFWTGYLNTMLPIRDDDPLKTIFSSPLGYSYNAFRQATLLYEEAVSDKDFDACCEDAEEDVGIYPEFKYLLQLVATQQHIRVVVVSCGLRSVWERVLKREGLSSLVKVIAGGRITDRFVVTAAVKAAVVSHLQNVHQARVWAFGDSPLDLQMLQQADEAIVVVGDKKSRSKTMDNALSIAIRHCGLKARQVLLPSDADDDHVTPRLEDSILPIVTLPNLTFSILPRIPHTTLPITLATDKPAAKLLTTRTRDSTTTGPALRQAHHRVGAYLATEYLTSLIGLEGCPISHVQGHPTTGHQLRNERQTVIIALMRAGEPMASGIHDVFPSAMFVHANGPETIKAHHLHGQRQVLLVDAVINSGNTVLECVDAIRVLDADIRIVVVTSVVQAKCTSPTSTFYKKLAGLGNMSLVALRRSDNRFTGSGGTDTGNRLFNTTHLP